MDKDEEIEITFSGIPVVAKVHKLKVKFSLDNSFDPETTKRSGKDILLEKLRSVKSKKILGKKLSKEDKILSKDWNNKNFKKYEIFSIIDVLTMSVDSEIDEQIIKLITNGK